MKILCIHGVSNEEKDNAFRPRWQAAIGGALLQAGGAGEPEYDYLEYDALFAKAGVDLSEYAEAGLRLLSSGLGSAFGDAFGMRSISDIGSVLRWTAGMVAQWVADDALREQLRTLLAGHVKDSAPDIVCAHSLGSLIAYDTFARAPEVAAGRVLMTFGSQIANPAVRGDVFGGRIVPIAGIGHCTTCTTPTTVSSPRRSGSTTAASVRSSRLSSCRGICSTTMRVPISGIRPRSAMRGAASSRRRRSRVRSARRSSRRACAAAQCLPDGRRSRCRTARPCSSASTNTRTPQRSSKAASTTYSA